MGRDVTKPVFGVSGKSSFKPFYSATEISLKIEISPVTRLRMILSDKRITKALISLRGCVGWSAPVLFANLRRQVFSRRGPNYSYIEDVVLFMYLNNQTFISVAMHLTWLTTSNADYASKKMQ